MSIWTLIAAEDSAPNPMTLPFMMIMMFAILYFLVFRPQKKREKERKQMMAGISKNDKVVTQGGIIGVVTNTKDEVVTVRIDDEKNVKVDIRRDFITGVLNTTDASAKKKASA